MQRGGTEASPMCLPAVAHLQLRLWHFRFKSQKGFQPKYALPKSVFKSETPSSPDRGPKCVVDLLA
jgi:hypothetical protein